jgi:predicted RNA polymerase sigma factor
LPRVELSPVVELNRAVAVAMRDGPAAGLGLVDAILARGDLQDYRLAHAARADLCRRLGDAAQARASYDRALALTRQEPERRFLERRLASAVDSGRRRSTGRTAEKNPMSSRPPMHEIARSSRSWSAADMLTSRSTKEIGHR